MCVHSLILYLRKDVKQRLLETGLRLGQHVTLIRPDLDPWISHVSPTLNKLLPDFLSSLPRQQITAQSVDRFWPYDKI